MNVLDAEGLQTYYGKSHILHAVSLRVREGGDRRSPRPQWCWQDNDAA